ncbi:hypothetical protein NBRC116590_38840 [Pelagimonas sp. KU-00592-HH]|uniref:class I SAM-dependent methyltransferase n=1 Tax=Pelagimonas sp. KU-00592-HH TaxID=3127651 RepID=UPI003102A302
MLNLPFTKYPITGAQVACPLCKSEDTIPLANWDRRFKRLAHVKCGACGLIRHDYMPSEDELSEYYRTTYRSDYQRVQDGPSDRHIAKRHKEAAVRLKRLTPHLKDGARLVDFGCGSAELVEDAIGMGYDARGFEPGSDYATYARDKKGLPVENCGWQDYSVDAPVDVVTTFHVFEHLLDPVPAVERILEWLADDGLFFIEVPDMNNALHKGFGCLHMAHTLGFSRYNLELLGAVCGLEVVEVFQDYDIGIIFRRGTPRPIEEIKADAVRQMAPWTKDVVHKTFWSYTAGKLKRR